MASGSASVKLSGTTPFPPSTPQYLQCNSSYFTAFGSELSPSGIARPESVEELSLLIKELVEADAHIAIKGGGHTPWKGAANIDNGITIDMSAINGVQLSADENIVSISAGERWGNVYKTLEKKGLAVVGGRVSRVGVTGLTLGG